MKAHLASSCIQVVSFENIVAFEYICLLRAV